MAGSSQTISVHTNTQNILIIKSAFVGDDTDGTIPTATVSVNRDAELVGLRYEVGGTPPTAAADFTLVDANGLDRTLGAGTNLITTTDGQAAVIDAATNSVHPVVAANETFTATYANTSAVDSVGTLLLVFKYL